MRTDRLRYLVGNDTCSFIKARAELPDQEYVDSLHQHFRDALGRPWGQRPVRTKASKASA